MRYNCDYLIIGAGIIGLSLAKAIKEKYPQKDVIVIEKEQDVAKHSSGRNSGVLHAGFYYSAQTLKAKLTKNGNLSLKNYVKQYGLKLNESKKVVVAKDKDELQTIFELEKRAKNNDVEAYVIDEKELYEIEPNAKTYQKALYSPTTATIDPKEVCNSLKDMLMKKGVKFLFNEAYKYKKDNIIQTSSHQIDAAFIINSAGLYADKIAKDFGFGKNYTIIPCKGIDLKYTNSDKPVKTNIYPTPNIKNPFLGVHYTITVDNEIKIGPTAIAAFWRENYKGFYRFNLFEMLDILGWESVLFLSNDFGFRDLAFEEFKKYDKNYLRDLASQMVKNIQKERFDKWSVPGIRAQLLDKRDHSLVEDFVVEGDKKSLHILNAVSPAFTASFAFSEYIMEKYAI